MYEVNKHKRKSTQSLRTYLPEGKYEELNNQVHERKEELQELISNGKSVFVQVHPTPVVGATVGRPGYIGSARKEWNLLHLLAMQPCNLVAKEGENIEYAENLPLKPELPYRHLSLKYAAVIKEAEGVPLLRIKGSQHVVGQVIKKDRGYIFLMPQFKWKVTDTKAEEHTAEFLHHLLDLAKACTKPKSSKLTPPLWSLDHLLAGEQEAKHELNELLRQKQALEYSIVTQEIVLQQYENMKIFLWGSGHELEAACAKVFSDLGFALEVPDPGRADIILHYGSLPAVVECKGVKGSAAEEYAAQLGKWVDMYYYDKQVMPKGILVVNTFKDKPVVERNEKHFPDQMLTYCKQRSFCLITGDQLLNKYMAYKSGMLTAESICKQLMDTVGEFKS